MILHIDMDAFFASIEQAVNPRLKGKPLIVGSRGSRMHTVVCAASYEAKRLGIGSGMSTAEAFKICPQAAFVAADQGKYIWTSEAIFAMLQEYGFWLNYPSIDEFQLDIGEHPDPRVLAEDIRRKIYANFNITASVGIAKNWLLAKLASKLNKPDGVAILNEEKLEGTLAKVPAGRLCGVGEKTQETLDSLGIKTCLDLYLKSPSFLERIFGQNGLNLYASLHAVESLETSVEPENPKSIGHSYTLPRASQNPRFIQAWIRLLSEMVGQRLRLANLVSQTVHLWLNGPEIGNFGTQKTFQIATNDSLEIYQRTLKIMARIGPRTPKIRAFGVTCRQLTLSRYEPLFEEEKRRTRLTQSLDKINQRFGEGAIYPAVTILTRKMQ